MSCSLSVTLSELYWITVSLLFFFILAVTLHSSFLHLYVWLLLDMSTFISNIQPVTLQQMIGSTVLFWDRCSAKLSWNPKYCFSTFISRKKEREKPKRAWRLPEKPSHARLKCFAGIVQTKDFHHPLWSYCSSPAAQVEQGSPAAVRCRLLQILLPPTPSSFRAYSAFETYFQIEGHGPKWSTWTQRESILAF